MKKLNEGATAEIFKFESGKVLKLYKPGFDHICNIEHQLMTNIRNFHIPMPKIYEKIQVDGRNGYSGWF